MFNENKMINEARNQGKRHSPILEVLICIAVMLVINFITSFFLSIALVAVIFRDPEILSMLSSDTAVYADLIKRVYNIMSALPEWVIILNLYLCIITAAIPVIYCKLIEKRSAASMGFRKTHAFSEYAVGLIIGAVMMGLAVFGCVLCGAVRIDGLSQLSVPVIVLYFFGYLIQGFAEEVALRGYFMVSMAKSTSVGYAVVISSFFFAIMHSANTNVSFIAYINLFLFGAFAGIYVLKRGSIWGIGAIHAMWNFTQGIIFGFNVSGINKTSHIINVTSVEGMDKLHGGSFGPEGGLIVTLVLFVALGLLMISRPNKREVYIPEPQTENTSESTENRTEL